MTGSDALREAGFRLRYALEQATDAVRQWNGAWQQAVDDELQRMRTARERQHLHRAQLDTEYQQWKRFLEGKTL